MNQEVGEIPLNTPPPPGNNPHAPAIIPISCYFMSLQNCVIIQSSSITTSAQVDIDNTTTGVSIHKAVLISSIPCTVNISGPGNYVITITLLSGVSYYGQFSV
ncbi:MAG: DUF3244 domain-containing protein [Bacteroidales bacterium]|nr:DUF3244 domain-containing protein [Bacteroidales bacterium]